MNYQDLMLYMSGWYALAILAVVAFLISFIVARFYHHKKGIFPRLSLQLTILGEWLLDGLSRVQHLYFGDTLEIPDSFYANEEAFKRAADQAKRYWTLILLTSFAVSYSSIVELAEWLGFEGYIPYLMPFIIDAIIVACIKTIESYARTGDRNTLAQFGVFGYTLLSVILNISHLAWGRDLSLLIFLGGISAPIGIWLCSEQTYKITMKMTYRSGVQKTDMELKRQIDDHRAEFEKLQADLATIESKAAELAEIEANLNIMRVALHEIDQAFLKSNPTIAKRYDQAKVLVDNGATPEDLAQTLNVQIKAARQYHRIAQNGTVKESA